MFLPLRTTGTINYIQRFVSDYTHYTSYSSTFAVVTVHVSAKFNLFSIKDCSQIQKLLCT